eukprot:IDg4276t1
MSLMRSDFDTLRTNSFIEFCFDCGDENHRCGDPACLRPSFMTKIRVEQLQITIEQMEKRVARTREIFVMALGFQIQSCLMTGSGARSDILPSHCDPNCSAKPRGAGLQGGRQSDK